MPNPLFWLVATVVLPTAETVINRFVRSPQFHRGVQRIHRAVEDYKYGRDPNDPLRQGEATRDPKLERAPGFFKYFTEELRNQMRGQPTEDLPPKNNSKTKR
ncbi:hypothetical protein SUNI508_06353 [Seiridium unicorne]|uniref:Uncharacterized protein n=1 Tax=Seiridium unicorne TaxID=138068 RepID=A0ABR2V1S9_9PEZI